MMSEEKIKNIVENVLEHVKGKGDTFQKDIDLAWDEVLTEEEKKHLKINSFENKYLFVKVSNSVWLYEIVVHHKEKILKAMKDHLGKETIKDIHYFV